MFTKIEKLPETGSESSGIEAINEAKVSLKFLPVVEVGTAPGLEQAVNINPIYSLKNYSDFTLLMTKIAMFVKLKCLH